MMRRLRFLVTHPCQIRGSTLALWPLTPVGIISASLSSQMEALLPWQRCLQGWRGCLLDPAIISFLQFQGKWYVVGLAGNNIRKEEQGQFNMYATNYQLKEDQSYNVTSILFR